MHDNSNTLFKQTENSNPNAGISFLGMKQNTNTNGNLTPQKFTNPGAVNTNNQNVFAPSSTNKSPLVQNNADPNSKSMFGNNNVNSSTGLFGNNNSLNSFGAANNTINNFFVPVNSSNNTSNKNIFSGNSNTPSNSNNLNTNLNLFGGSNVNNNSNNLSSNNNINNSILGANQSNSNINLNSGLSNNTNNNSNANNTLYIFGANNNQNSVNKNNNFFLGNNIADDNQKKVNFNNNNNIQNNSNGTLFANNSSSISNNLNNNQTSLANSFVSKNESFSNNNSGNLFGYKPGDFKKPNDNSAFTNINNSNNNPQINSNLLGNSSLTSNSNSLFGNNQGSNTNPNNAGINPISGGDNSKNQTNIDSSSKTNPLFGNKTQSTSNNLFGNNKDPIPNQDLNKNNQNLFGNSTVQSNNTNFNLFNNPTLSSNINANQNSNTINNTNASSTNLTTNKPNESNYLFGNNSTTNNTKQESNNSIFGNTNNSSISSTNQIVNSGTSNTSGSLFSSKNQAGTKPGNQSLFGNSLTNPVNETNKTNNENTTGSSLFNTNNTQPKTQETKTELNKSDNIGLSANLISTATNSSSNGSNNLFKSNTLNNNGKITSPIKNNTGNNNNLSSVNINQQKRGQESISKIHQLMIYPNPLHRGQEEQSINKPVSYENNLESRKNILGISRNEISERVIQAISNKMTIKEFFAKAYEESIIESRISNSKSKTRKNENHYEIFEEGYSRSKDSYLETKYQMYLQREILKQKQKIESKKKLEEEKNLFNFSENKSEFGNKFKAKERHVYKTFEKKNYRSLLEKNFEINKIDSPYNYNLANVNKANNFYFKESDFPRNYNQNNFELIKVTNEINFGNEKLGLEMQNKKINVTENIDNLNKQNLYSGKTDPKISLIENSEIDLYDQTFWQSKIKNETENKDQDNIGLTNHLVNIKDDIKKFFSIFSTEEAIEKAFENKKENANENKKILSIVAEVKDKNIFLSFHSHKETNVSVLKEYIAEKLIERNQRKFSYLKKEDLLILFKSSILVDENTLGNYEFNPNAENFIYIIFTKGKEIENKSDNLNSNNKIQENNAIISKENELRHSQNMQRNRNHSHLKRLSNKSKSPGKENINKTNFNNQIIIGSGEKKEIKFIEDDYLPKYNNDFDLFPSIHYLYRMKKSELKSVEGFKISNNYGKIKFKTSVDLTYLNLSEIFKIDLYTIELYPETQMPKPGEGLNKPAIITIKQMFEQKENLKEFIQSLKTKGGKFISYNEYKGKFKFEVERWIK